MRIAETTVGQVDLSRAKLIADREARRARIDAECEKGMLLVAANVFSGLWINGEQAKASSESLSAAARFERAWRGRYGK